MWPRQAVQRGRITSLAFLATLFLMHLQVPSPSPVPPGCMAPLLLCLTLLQNSASLRTLCQPSSFTCHFCYFPFFHFFFPLVTSTLQTKQHVMLKGTLPLSPQRNFSDNFSVFCLTCPHQKPTHYIMQTIHCSMFSYSWGHQFYYRYRFCDTGWHIFSISLLKNASF